MRQSQIKQYIWSFTQREREREANTQGSPVRSLKGFLLETPVMVWDFSNCAGKAESSARRRIRTLCDVLYPLSSIK